MDTLYTFWDNTTHYKTKSVHFLGLMNSATTIIGGMSWVSESNQHWGVCKAGSSIPGTEKAQGRV